jgi:hypothetical protein
MSPPEERLRALSARVERLAIAPAEVARERPWLRVAGPLFRLFGWRPEIRTVRLCALLDALRDVGSNQAVRTGIQSSLTDALDELDESIAAAERAATVCGPAAHGPIVGWLTRLHDVTSRAARAAADPDDAAKRSVALAPFTTWALTSLATRPPGDRSDPDRRTSSGGPEDVLRSSPETDPRLLDLELAAVDRVLDAARAETHFLGRRRRLFEAARKLLLDAAAALPLDPAAAHARAQHVADEIVLINRLEAAGVDPDVALPHQALSALARGERQKLYATLRASADVACGAGDVAVAARSREALRRLDARARTSPRAEADLSARELLGEPAVVTIRDAYESARREHAIRKLAPPRRAVDAAELEERAALWERYLHDDAVLATLSAAVSVDGCFEVGGTLSPVRVEEQVRRVRVVSYPTQDLVLVPTADVTDLPSAVIDDPRGVILALAQGRLVARKFRRVDDVRTARTRMTSEARVYVLDGSDSMLMGGRGRASGARARMRDATLLAELATLYRRASVRGRSTRVVLFYRYFTKLLGEVARVESAEDALRAMASVVTTPRHGGTDIQSALLASFEQIRQARATDPELARAQIVLVTDGAAAVDEDAVRAAREREGNFPIGVSVIALGEENDVLRQLVARQRARGEPAFYHFVSDDDLAAIVEGRRAAGAPVHAPPEGSIEVEALTAELGSLVEEIDALSRSRTAGRPELRASTMGTADPDALAALGLAHRETEGERARREAMDRDERALTARFDAWFPPAPAPDPATSSGDRAAPPDGAALDPAAPDLARTDEDPAAWVDDAEAALVVLTALADVVADLGGTPADRRADAVDLLERLLPDARLPPARYLEIVRAPPAPIAAALSAVRAAALGSGKPAPAP